MGMVVAHELVGDHTHLTTFILFYYFLVELFFSELGWGRPLCLPMGCSTIEVGVSWMTLT